MKFYFIRLFMEPETKTGGFTPEEKKELGDALAGVQAALETKQKAIVEAELKKHADTINDALKKYGDWQTQKDADDKKNQEALDGILSQFKEMQKVASTGSRPEAKSLEQAIVDAFQKKENIEGYSSVSRGQKFKMMLEGPIDLTKSCEVFDPNIKHKMAGDAFEKKGTMTSANTITGDPVVTYSPNQAILPAQQRNFREFMRTVRSETGTYVHYKETAQTGAFARTLQNEDKPEVEYHFTEVKTVTEYIAGLARFAKRLRNDLPWLQGTLPTLLRRSFFEAENRRFWDVVFTAFNAGGGSAATTETEDIKQLMDWVTNQLEAKFMPSVAIARFTALNNINKNLLGLGNNQNAAGVISRPDGSLIVNGVPVIPVTWIPSKDKVLIYDQDFMERVEVESLALEFFEEDRDNVPKNLITARLECLEEINPMLPPSIIVGDFGNSSSS